MPSRARAFSFEKLVAAPVTVTAITAFVAVGAVVAAVAAEAPMSSVTIAGAPAGGILRRILHRRHRRGRSSRHILLAPFTVLLPLVLPVSHVCLMPLVPEQHMTQAESDHAKAGQRYEPVDSNPSFGLTRIDGRAPCAFSPPGAWPIIFKPPEILLRRS